MISDLKNFYYTTNKSSYNIFFKDIRLSLKKCQLVKVWTYLELKEKKLDSNMNLCFYGTIHISLKIDEFIKLKRLVQEMLSNTDLNQYNFSISKNLLN